MGICFHFLFMCWIGSVGRWLWIEMGLLDLTLSMYCLISQVLMRISYDKIFYSFHILHTQTFPHVCTQLRSRAMYGCTVHTQHRGTATCKWPIWKPVFTLTWVEKAWIFFHTYFVTDSQLEIDSVTHEVGQLGEVGRHINFHLIINKNEKKKKS